MKIKLIIIFLYTTILFAQKPIEIVIDTITFTDITESNVREFSLNYSIKNETNTEISCFLNTKSLFPSIVSSLRYVPTYRIFQNEVAIETSNILLQNKNNLKFDIKNNEVYLEYLKKSFDSIKSNLKSELSMLDYYFDKKNKNIMGSIFTLKPKEVKRFNQKLYWNKIRYLKNDDLEYYFDEKDSYYIQLELTLLKNEYVGILLKEEFEKIISNPNFINGNFSSNKMELNFKE